MGRKNKGTEGQIRRREIMREKNVNQLEKYVLTLHSKQRHAFFNYLVGLQSGIPVI